MPADNALRRDDENTHPTPLDEDLQIGDLVKLAHGTLTWSAERMLRGKVGQVIARHNDGSRTPRFTVQFSIRKTLERREMTVFEFVERPSLFDQEKQNG